MESFFIFKNTLKPEKIIAEKNGFNFMFFFLGPILGIFKGLWIEGFSWIAIICSAIYLTSDLSFFFIFASAIFWGFFGKDIYIQKLLKSNYIPKGVVISSSPKKAVLIFSSKN